MSIQLESTVEPYAECSQSKILDFYHTEEERMVNYSGNWKYVYDLKDHLGPVRVSFAEDSTTQHKPMFTQVNHYYPFGMKIEQLSVTIGYPSDYPYNGKEFQDEFGLNWFPYGARYYDPGIGRARRLSSFCCSL